MLIMRLQSREVTPETANAVAAISRFIAMLAHYFKLDDEDRLFNPDKEK